MHPVEYVEHILLALYHQWRPLLFIVLPMVLVAYNHLPDPVEIFGCIISKFFDKETSDKSWSWAAFEAKVERDRRKQDAGPRPMTRSKARILYAMFGHERVPYKQA
eukprot:TRINITY_DN56708_c0_g1_i1.p4 TRINITY_DN56708_c0_g1~~TRINITY_DN56708_c0_g1_i1.p4  ORF type:complete len:106 (-),score=20.33 TRINITY_DN56708_c0_g1_i1:210-527(-)